MAIISLLFTSLLIITSATTHHHLPPTKNAPSPSDRIRQACKATRNPQLCQSSLTTSPNPNPIQILQSAVSVSLQNLHTAQSKIQAILSASNLPANPNRTTAANLCIQHLHNSEYRLNSTAHALPREIKNCRAWTSAALTYQYECWSTLSNANNTKIVIDTVSFINNTLIGCTSNALSMMMAYDVVGEKMELWGPPKTERDGFWGRGGPGGRRKVLGVPNGLKADVTVCKGGGCEYGTVRGAVDAAPKWVYGRRFVIFVKAGVYKESVRVGLEKRNVVVLGEGMGKTIISGSANVGQPGMTTYNSATVDTGAFGMVSSYCLNINHYVAGILGDGFMASNLTIENAAGPGAHQAVALRINSDQSVIENCELLGNQDTLYLHSLRQFFKSCRIQGNVDFIFGDSATVFQDCIILIRPRQITPEKGEKNAVTAHGRKDPAQTTGFVFRNCLVNGTQEYMKLYHSNPNVHLNFLGRPWKEFSRTVFIGCKLEALISPPGWMPWSSGGDFALKTLYYGEFNNSGKGSELNGRVEWSNRMPAEHLDVYSITNFIQGDQWKLN